MDLFNGSEEEDNNPFAGTTHLYASGIAAVTEGQDDYDFAEQLNNNDSNQASNISDVIEEAIEGTEGGFSDKGEQMLGDMMLTSKYVAVPGEENNTGESTIAIVDAGQYRDSYGKFAIGYKIQFEKNIVTRRYSEFDSLRQSLCRLLPTIIIPPIPSKHPIIKYLFNPLYAEKDIKIIEKRQRMLTCFLNNCYTIDDIRNHVVFRKFLNPDYVWRDVLNSAPISILPANNLLAPPLAPTKPSPLHLLLPSPAHLTMSRQEHLLMAGDETELKFKETESFLKDYQKLLHPLYKILKQTRAHVQSHSSKLSEIGAYFNAFSLENNVFQISSALEQLKFLSNGIEKVGQAVDVNYVSTEYLSEEITKIFEERINEMIQFIKESQRVIQFRHLKQEQYHVVETTIKKRRDRIKKLEEADTQSARLEEALKLNAEDSPTVAQAIESINQRTVSTGSSDRQILGLFKPPSGSSTRRSVSETIGKDLEPHLLTQDERREEIAKLEKELEKLNECYKLIEKDLQQINASMMRSLGHLQLYLNNTWLAIVRELSHLMVSWLKECLQSWKNAKQAIQDI